MKPAWRRSALPVLAAILVLPACSEEQTSAPDAPVGLLGEENEETVTSPPEPEAGQSTQESHSGADPSDSPDPQSGELTVSQVDIVMNTIVEANTGLLIDVLGRDAGNSLQSGDKELLSKFNSGEQLDHFSEELERLALDQDERQAFRPISELSPASWTTEELVIANEECTVAAGYYDLSGMSATADSDDFAMLASLAPENDDSGVNETGWTLLDFRPLISGGEPIPREQWFEVDFSTVLETSCESGD